MTKRICIRLLFLLFISVSALSVHAAADNAITKKEAVAMVVSAYPGKVLRTMNVKRQGKPFYQVRVLLPGGRIVNVLVNAQTGRMRKL